MSVMALNMHRCEPDFMLSGTRVDVGVPLLTYTKRPYVTPGRKVSYPYVLDTTSVLSTEPQARDKPTVIHEPRPPDFHYTDVIIRNARPSTVRTERKVNSAVSRTASRLSHHSAVSHAPTIVDTYDYTLSQILPETSKIVTSILEKDSHIYSPPCTSQYASLTRQSSLPQSTNDTLGIKHVAEWAKSKSTRSKRASVDDVAELQAAREQLGLSASCEPEKSNSPSSGRSTAMGSQSGTIDEPSFATMSNQKLPKSKRKKGSRRKSGRKSRLKTYNKKSRQSISSNSVVIESKIAMNILCNSARMKKAFIDDVGAIDGLKTVPPNKSEPSPSKADSSEHSRKSNANGSNQRKSIVPFTTSSMQANQHLEQLIQGVPAMSLSTASTFKRSTTPRRSYSTTPRKSYEGTRSLDDHASRLVKVYLSQRQSGMLKELGMDYPCAPPATPVPDLLQKYEYVPCMFDIKSQREVKSQLEGMAKTASKKKEKEMEVKLKQERQNQKERERGLRLEQRKMIYALNKVMTEWENGNFEAFCLTHGLNTKSKEK